MQGFCRGQCTGGASLLRPRARGVEPRHCGPGQGHSRWSRRGSHQATDRASRAEHMPWGSRFRRRGTATRRFARLYHSTHTITLKSICGDPWTWLIGTEVQVRVWGHRWRYFVLMQAQCPGIEFYLRVTTGRNVSVLLLSLVCSRNRGCVERPRRRVDDHQRGDAVSVRRASSVYRAPSGHIPNKSTRTDKIGTCAAGEMFPGSNCPTCAK
jgi:hypothetical protein